MKTISLKDLQDTKNPGNGWYMIEAAGEHTHRDENEDGKIIERTLVIDEEAIKKIVESFRDEILVDRDHLSHDMDKDTAAMGWVKDLAGLEEEEGKMHLAAFVEFTSLGEPLIKGRAYKHWSTEYPAISAEVLENNKFRPTNLTGLALTNRPNNAAGQRPISNRTTEAPDNTSPSQDPGNPDIKNSEEETPKTTQQQSMDTIPELKRILGLTEDATDQSLIEAVTTLADTASGAAVAEAETLVEGEGLSDLPDEVKQELIDELVTNRKRGLILLEGFKNRQPGTSTPPSQPRYQGRANRPPLDSKAKGVVRERLILSRTDEIQKSYQAKGKTLSFWKARSLAVGELEKASKI